MTSKPMCTIVSSAVLGLLVSVAYADDPPPKAAAPAKTAASPVKKPLDLHIDKRELEEHVQQISGSGQRLPDEQAPSDTESVEVSRARATPDVPDGLASIYWAVTHPLQAWRILFPDSSE